MNTMIAISKALVLALVLVLVLVRNTQRTPPPEEVEVEEEVVEGVIDDSQGTMRRLVCLPKTTPSPLNT
jgi:hypothetical protein